MGLDILSMRSKRIGLVWIERAGYHGPLPSPPGASPRWAAAPPPRHLQLPAVAHGIVFLQLFLLLQRCLPPNKCVVICFSSLPDHVCIPWPPLPFMASTRSGLSRHCSWARVLLASAGAARIVWDWNTTWLGCASTMASTSMMASHCFSASVPGDVCYSPGG